MGIYIVAKYMYINIYICIYSGKVGNVHMYKNMHAHFSVVVKHKVGNVHKYVKTYIAGDEWGRDISLRPPR